MAGHCAGFAAARPLPRVRGVGVGVGVVASAQRPQAAASARVQSAPARRARTPQPLPLVPPAHVEISRRAQPARKPNGYWNELANVERALVEVNDLIPGRAGKKIMPTTAELKELGRNDLLAALAKHSGMKKVAELLGWVTGKKRKMVGGTRRRSRVEAPVAKVASPRSVVVGTGDMLLAGSLLSHAGGLTQVRVAPNVTMSQRVAIPRRPKHYWDDIGKVMSSISAFIAEYGTPGVMPTGKEFADSGQGALRQAAQRHGGLGKVAARMGLKSRTVARKKNTWGDREFFIKALTKYTEQHDPGVMPTASELKAAGENQLANAVTSHGGYPAVARDLGLIVRNSRKEGAPEIWDRETLVSQLQTFTATFHPALALANRMPSESQLRRCGRNDLCYAICKWGGYKRVQETLGFSPRPVGPRISPGLARRISGRKSTS